MGARTGTQPAHRRRPMLLPWQRHTHYHRIRNARHRVGMPGISVAWVFLELFMYITFGLIGAWLVVQIMK